MSKFIVMNTKKEVREMLKELNIAEKKEAKVIMGEAALMIYSNTALDGSRDLSICAADRLKKYFNQLDGVTMSEFMDALWFASESVLTELYGND